MTEATQPHKRVRINVSRTSKGLYSYEATVEVSAVVRHTVKDGVTSYFHDDSLWLQDFALKESDYLIAQLNAKYPAPEA